MSSIFAPIKTLSRSQYVFDTVKDAIFSAKLKAGSPITELQLARDFNVSQSTIREALMQLEKVGLVVKIPHKGTFVTKMSDNEIRQRLIVRYHLEELAATQAAKNMDEAHFKELNHIVEKFQNVIRRQSYFELTKVDLQFHRYIWKQSGNDVLYNTLDQISVPLFAFVSLQRSIQEQDMKQVIVPHERIVNALESRDDAIIVDVIRKDARESYRKYFVS